jgi:hypothetical protein
MRGGTPVRAFPTATRRLLFVTYIATGGHRTEDAKTNGIRCIRLRVRADHSGIDLLPAPNRSARQ